MKLNNLRYVVVSLIALFAVVASVNAVGVFYYDAAANQFVLDGSLKISDPGSFKLLLRELNSTDDSHLYINGRKDVQIRIDADNTESSTFKINNGGPNATVFSVDESGKINTGIPTVIDSNTTVNGTLTTTGAATFASLTSTGVIDAKGNIRVGINASTDGSISFIGGSYIAQDNDNTDDLYLRPIDGHWVTVAGSGTGLQAGNVTAARLVASSSLCIGGTATANCKSAWPTVGTIADNSITSAKILNGTIKAEDIGATIECRVRATNVDDNNANTGDWNGWVPTSGGLDTDSKDYKFAVDCRFVSGS